MIFNKCNHYWHPVGKTFIPWYSTEFFIRAYCPKCHRTKRFTEDRMIVELDKQKVLNKFEN